MSLSPEEAEAFLQDLTSYENPTPKMEYSLTPPGKIKFSKGKLYFGKKHMGVDRNPKKIIITDWFRKKVGFDSYHQFLKYRSSLKLLLDQGAECYVWTGKEIDGKLTKVTDIQDLMQKLALIEYIAPDELAKKIKDAGFSKDAHEIINFGRAREIEAALSPLTKIESYYTKKTIPLEAFENEDDCMQCLQELEGNSDSEYTTIKITNKTREELLLKVMQRFPNIKYQFHSNAKYGSEAEKPLILESIKKKYTDIYQKLREVEIYLDYQHALNTNKSRLSCEKNMDTENLKKDTDFLSNLNAIRSIEQGNYETLSSLLPNCTKLKNLSFLFEKEPITNNIKKLTDALKQANNINTLILNNFQEVNDRDSLDKINDIIKNLPGVEKLIVDINENFEKIPAMEKLTSLKLNMPEDSKDITLSTESLKKHKNLKKLQISFGHFGNNKDQLFQFLGNENFENITELSAQDYYMHNNYDLLKRFPNIESLDLQIGSPHKISRSEEPLDLKKLSHLKISSKIRKPFTKEELNDNIIQIIKTAPNLKSLDVDINIDLLKKIERPLIHVKKLDFSGEISPEELELLMEKFPNLEELKFSSLKEPFNQTTKTYEKIKMLSLHISYNTPYDARSRIKQKIKELFPNAKEIYDEGGYLSNRDTDLKVKTVNYSTSKKPDNSSNLITDKKPEPNKESIPHPPKKEKPDLNSIEKNVSLDGKTGSKENENHVKRIFLPKENGEPYPNNYRIQLFDKIKIDKKIEMTYETPLKNQIYREIPKNNNDLFSLYNNNEKYLNSDHVFYGQFEIPVNHTDWYPVPSLSRKDHILNLSCSEDLKYTYFKGQAYVKAKEDRTRSKSLSISLIVDSQVEKYMPISDHQKTQRIDNAELKSLQFNPDGIIDKSSEIFKKIQKLTTNEKLDCLFNFCSSFSVDDLNSKPNSNNDIETLNAIIRESKGACRHRSEVFLALAQAFDVSKKVAVVISHCHEFIEAEVNGSWKTMDLGGAPSKLTVEPMKINNEVIVPQIEQAVSHNGHIIEKELPESEDDDEDNNTEKELTPDNPFITWESLQSKATNLEEYCEELKTLSQTAMQSTEDPQNILVMLDADKIEAFHKIMVKTIQKSGKKSHYIHNLNDISEQDVKVNSDGTLETIDSELFSFLKNQDTTKGPNDTPNILMTNFSSYNASQVGYNSMMDRERKLKSTPIQQNTVNIVLLDKAKVNHVGEDFYSRCHLKTTCPDFSELESVQSILSKQSLETSESKNFQKAEFFDDDWQGLLLGRVGVHHQKYSSIPGLLVKAIQEKKPGLILENAPWNSTEFRVFMNELYVKKILIFNGQTYQIPPDFKIISQTKNHSFSATDVKAADPSLFANPDSKPFILNTQTFDTFFDNMRSERDGSISELPGFIEANQGTQDNPKEMLVYVTETLSKTNWAQLLKATKNKDGNQILTLKIALAPNVTVPIPNTDLKTIQTIQQNHATLIQTNDLELAEEEVFEAAKKESLKLKEPLVVSINANTTFNDIFEIKKSKEGSSVLIESIQGDCLKKLLAGETVILKGKLSPEFAKEMESLFLSPPYLILNGERVYPEKMGKLVILTEEKNPLLSTHSDNKNYNKSEYLQKLEEKYFSHGKNQDKRDLFEKFKKSLSELKQKHLDIQFSYGQLNEMLGKMIKSTENTPSNPFKPYFRLNPSNPVLETAKELWGKDKSGKILIEDVMKKRHTKITKELNNSPYLFIVGPSGAGKSTYILEGLKDTKGGGKEYQTFIGIDNLDAWLKDPTGDEKHVLFIDEANLERDGTWDILEGIFNKTPGIMKDGEIHPISDKHKVIFAGNFSHFAGRYEHEYFKRHGQIFNFKELPDEFLSKKIILPSLEILIPDSTKLNVHQRKEINDIFINIYKELNQNPPHHPMTPRNLKTMCLRLATQIKEGGTLNDATLKQIIYTVTLAEMGNFLNNDQKTRFETEAIPPLNIPPQPFLGSDSFVITPSREPALRLLHEQMNMREIALAQKLDSFPVPGLLIEGPAGVGKSQMAIEYLKSQNKPYYHITPTDPIKMEETLIKAFHEGAVVVIDEFNSLPLERLMNQLLSGVDQDGRKVSETTMDGKLIKPGFFVIATQNPITFSKRQQLSTALENRFRKIEAGDYPEKELRDIAKKMCGNKNPQATKLVNQYLVAKQYAEDNHKTPAPSPRNLFRGLAKIAAAQKNKTKKIEPKIDPKKDLLYHYQSGTEKNKPQPIITPNNNNPKAPPVVF